jgi:hypothetical protein
MVYNIGYLRLGGPNRLTGGGGARRVTGGPYAPPVCMLKKALARTELKTAIITYKCTRMSIPKSRDLMAPIPGFQD